MRKLISPHPMCQLWIGTLQLSTAPPSGEPAAVNTLTQSFGLQGLQLLSWVHTKSGLLWSFFEPIIVYGRTTISGLFLPNVDSPSSASAGGHHIGLIKTFSHLHCSQKLSYPVFLSFLSLYRCQTCITDWRLPSPMLNSSLYSLQTFSPNIMHV